MPWLLTFVLVSRLNLAAKLASLVVATKSHAELPRQTLAPKKLHWDHTSIKNSSCHLYPLTGKTIPFL